MQSAIVNWQIRNAPPAPTWLLTMTVGGRSYDVARVEAVDRDSAVKALATQVEMALGSWHPRTDE